MANKITYGLSNAHVWPITSTSDEGVPTYGTIINLPGATELSLDAEGSSDPFYADDKVYYQGTANNGYSGSITLADLPDAFLETVMLETKDKNGAHIENSRAMQLRGDIFSIAARQLVPLLDLPQKRTASLLTLRSSLLPLCLDLTTAMSRLVQRKAMQLILFGMVRHLTRQIRPSSLKRAYFWPKAALLRRGAAYFSIGGAE